MFKFIYTFEVLKQLRHTYRLIGVSDTPYLEQLINK